MLRAVAVTRTESEALRMVFLYLPAVKAEWALEVASRGKPNGIFAKSAFGCHHVGLIRAMAAPANHE